MRLVLPLAASLLLACGSDADPPAPSPTPEPATTDPEPIDERGAVEPAPSPPSAEERASFRARRATARAAVRDGDAVAGLRLFDALVRERPNDPRLLCEAGDAAERAERLGTAARYLDSALAMHRAGGPIRASMRTPLAMCLYNRGRVYEARGRYEAARQAYAESLALRPHDVVAARLADVDPPELDEEVWPSSLAELGEVLRRDADDRAEGVRSFCRVEIGNPVVAATDESDHPALAVLVGEGEAGCPTAFDAYYLAVLTDAGYRLLYLGEVPMPMGDSPNEEEGGIGEVSFRAIDDLEGVRWRVEYVRHLLATSGYGYAREGDDEDEETVYCWEDSSTSAETRHAVLCSDESCASLVLSETTETTSSDDCVDEEDVEDEGSAPASLARTLVLEGGEIRIATTSGSVASHTIADGTYTVALYLARAHRLDLADVPLPLPDDEDDEDGEEEDEEDEDP